MLVDFPEFQSPSRSVSPERAAPRLAPSRPPLGRPRLAPSRPTRKPSLSPSQSDSPASRRPPSPPLLASRGTRPHLAAARGAPRLAPSRTGIPCRGLPSPPCPDRFHTFKGVRREAVELQPASTGSIHFRSMIHFRLIHVRPVAAMLAGGMQCLRAMAFGGARGVLTAAASPTSSAMSEWLLWSHDCPATTLCAADAWHSS